MKNKLAAAFKIGCAAVAIVTASRLSTASDEHEKTVLLSPGQVAYFSGPPSNHESILFWGTWDKQVQHNENAPVDCFSTEAEYSSQCRAILHTNAPLGATHAMLKVKVKSWVTNAKSKGGFNYALIYASAPVPGYTANHFIHTETFGRGADGQGENRRVEFSNVVVPIIDDAVTINVGKEIAGKSVAEIVVYLSGFLSAPEAIHANSTKEFQEKT